MNTPSILYFSLNRYSVNGFYSYCSAKNAEQIISFRTMPRYGKGGVSHFKCANDLILYLESAEESHSLPKFVIIDYISLSSNLLDDRAFSIFESRKILLRAILKYPEITFLFDETRTADDEGDDFCFIDFLFPGEEVGTVVFKDYHSFCALLDVRKAFRFVICGHDNLFDGSNLRFAARRFLHNLLKVNRLNFSLPQESRKNSLALCVEEEHSQNRFNSYALYANGFRVLPVVTAEELHFFNEMAMSEDIFRPILIVRDYDLQFPDARGECSLEIDNKEYSISVVDFIRGVKYWDTERGESCPDKYKNKWYIPNLEPLRNRIELTKDKKEKEELKQSVSKLTFWSYLQNIHTLFISKGVDGRIEFCMSNKDFEKHLKDIYKTEPQNIESIFRDNVSIQVLRGVTKPVSGLYSPFSGFNPINERLNSFLITSEEDFIVREIEALMTDANKNSKRNDSLLSFLIKKYDLSLNGKKKLLKRIKHMVGDTSGEYKGDDWKTEFKNQAWAIDTSRENHNHGIPLDVYDLVQSMLRRARYYFDIGKYIRSAMIASDTIELLNGFHEALMLQAYHILSVSENAIAMNVLGGDERELRLDAEFRINKIENEVSRMLARPNNSDRRELRYNILNQIFSDCRNFCKIKEHFDAEEVFLSAMGHVNVGYTPRDIDYEIKKIWNKAKQS